MKPEQAEAFALAGFVLSTTLLRELVIQELVTKERAIRLLEASISTLRHLYGNSPRDVARMMALDTVDWQGFVDAFHEKEAEVLIRGVWDSIVAHGKADS